MNGQPLTPDHGAPVRLVVPGWYGCAWIKWVNEIRWVTDDEPATSQMREFAGRTHQEGQPALARDYRRRRAIDTAAMPMRVEQRRVDGATEYRVVGIVWGGTAPVDRLVIALRPARPRHARTGLSGAGHCSHLGTVDASLAPGRAGLLRHQPQDGGPGRAHAPSRPVVLHPPRAD